MQVSPELTVNGEAQDKPELRSVRLGGGLRSTAVVTVSNNRTVDMLYHSHIKRNFLLRSLLQRSIHNKYRKQERRRYT